MTNTDTFYIDFDTKEMPGRLVALEVTLKRKIIPKNEMDKPLSLNLIDHPLYKKLESYVMINGKKP